MLKAALREFTLVHAMSAARRQMVADLWTKPIGLNRLTKQPLTSQRVRLTKVLDVESLTL